MLGIPLIMHMKTTTICLVTTSMEKKSTLHSMRRLLIYTMMKVITHLRFSSVLRKLMMLSPTCTADLSTKLMQPTQKQVHHHSHLLPDLESVNGIGSGTALTVNTAQIGVVKAVMIPAIVPYQPTTHGLKSLK